jgi:hypothetical protein
MAGLVPAIYANAVPRHPGAGAPGGVDGRRRGPPQRKNSSIAAKPVYRPPKIALPTRTQVAPQAMAISKSADIPIDSVPNPCLAARSASQVK